MSTASQVSAFSSPHSSAPSWWRICQTKCGAFIGASSSGVRITGSFLAASYSAAVCFEPDSTLRVGSAMKSSTLLRRMTTSESAGTTSVTWAAGQSAPSSTTTLHSRIALRARSNLVGDWGIAARTANCASESWLRSLPK